ncbi:MAG: NUMOD3 domain-containing DNA-binding protein [Gallionella sp.]|jgi:hypothetical protein|nr:NUMOD3 domain-containing DNA-binding protein [Gallionella sp.]
MKRHFTEEHKRKLSEAAKRRKPSFLGKHHSLETRAKLKLSHLGKKRQPHTKETRRKMSEIRKGIKFSSEHIQKLRDSHLGIKMSDQAKNKLSKHFRNAHKGKKNPMYNRRGSLSPKWKGGLTAKHLIVRGSLEYRLWREAVFKRDSYTCIKCGDNRGGNLEADHIKPFSLYPELRFAIDNGRTLCHSCHQQTDTYGYRVYHYAIC